MYARIRGGIKVFAAELRRRRVPQTALWYIGTAVAVVEAANAFQSSLGIPAGAMRLIAVAALFGLPVALTLSWVYDVSAATPRTWKRVFTVLAVSALSLVGALAVWNHKPMAVTTDTAFTVDPAHIAVLPFVADSADRELSSFAANLQSRLIDGLSSAAAATSTPAKRLRVVSRASILPFSRPDIPLDSLRRALKVGTVLDGSVQRTADGVRVQVRMVDAQTGDQLAVADTTAGDRLTVLDAVATSVTDMIRKKLGKVVEGRMRLLETRNPDAFDRYLLAMQRLDQFAPAYKRRDIAAAQATIEDADSLLTEAEKLDRNWIEPTVERARLSSKRVLIAMATNSDTTESINQGIRHADRALKAHANDYRALTVRGELKALLFDVAPPMNEAKARELLRSAEGDLQAALLSNPTPARALRVLSEVTGKSGRLEEAIDYGRRAYDADPYLEQAEVTVFRLFEHSLSLEREKDAAHWCAEGRNRFHNPIFDDCRLSLAAWTDSFSLRPDSAWRLVQSELSEYPTPLRVMIEPRLSVMYGAVLARNQLPDSARAVLARAQRADTSAGVVRAAAGVMQILGNADSADVLTGRLFSNRANERRELERAPELRAILSRRSF